MTERFATTPFGGGRMRAPVFLGREAVEARRRALREAGPGSNETGKADKWRLLRALTEARAAFGLSDRSIVVLEALASCWQDKELDGAAELVVFPSNQELSLRSRGMAPATIRRHLAALVEAGMILRRDSANGKRFCRRGEHGEVTEAFGFDLAPFAQKAAAIHAAAEEARARARAVQKLRGEITIHRRDIAKVVEAAMHEGRAGDWPGFTVRLAACGGAVPRHAALEALEERRALLLRLRAEVETAYLESLDSDEMSANDADFERHHQNSNTDHHLENRSEKELKPASDREDGEASGKEGPEDAGRMDRESGQQAAAETKSVPLTLERLRRACPQLGGYARDGLAGWRDVIAAAALVRPMLGISPDAWARARAAMGDMAAAVTVAAILERSDEIRSAGGYLRALTERAEAGKFSVMPMIAALENRGG